MRSQKADNEDLSGPPLLEGDEEGTIVEKVKSNPRKRKNEGKGLEILTPNRLLTRLRNFNSKQIIN